MTTLLPVFPASAPGLSAIQIQTKQCIMHSGIEKKFESKYIIITSPHFSVFLFSLFAIVTLLRYFVFVIVTNVTNQFSVSPGMKQGLSVIPCNITSIKLVTYSLFNKQ